VEPELLPGPEELRVWQVGAAQLEGVVQVRARLEQLGFPSQGQQQVELPEMRASKARAWVL
jgi:hypothetical protein